MNNIKDNIKKILKSAPTLVTLWLGSTDSDYDSQLSTKVLSRRNPLNYHNFHILKPSIWPFAAALSLLLLAFGLVNWFYTGKLTILLIGLLQVVIVVFFWWSDVSQESGETTEEIVKNLKIGMALFIVSEVMFFFSFFWAFFQVSLVPGHEVGGVWPPIGLENLVIDPWSVPLLNTVLLLSSGVTVTCAHHALLYYFETEKLLSAVSFRVLRIRLKLKTYFSFERILLILILLKKQAINLFFLGIEMLAITIILALLFTALQLYEYIESLIRISDSAYGSTFFVMTGFHGLHVIVGTIFLTVCLCRIIFNHFYYKVSVGLEASIWYWHFVDVIWILLYIAVYMWGNKQTKTRVKKEDFSWATPAQLKKKKEYDEKLQKKAELDQKALEDYANQIANECIKEYKKNLRNLNLNINDKKDNLRSEKILETPTGFEKKTNDFEKQNVSWFFIDRWLGKARQAIYDSKLTPDLTLLELADIAKESNDTFVQRANNPTIQRALAFAEDIARLQLEGQHERDMADLSLLPLGQQCEALKREYFMTLNYISVYTSDLFRRKSAKRALLSDENKVLWDRKEQFESHLRMELKKRLDAEHTNINAQAGAPKDYQVFDAWMPGDLTGKERVELIQKMNKQELLYGLYVQRSNYFVHTLLQMSLHGRDNTLMINQWLAHPNTQLSRNMLAHNIILNVNIKTRTNACDDQPEALMFGGFKPYVFEPSARYINLLSCPWNFVPGYSIFNKYYRRGFYMGSCDNDNDNDNAFENILPLPLTDEELAQFYDFDVNGFHANDASSCDFAEPGQYGFQDSATPTMDGIADLHHKIMAYLILIFIVVIWLMFSYLSKGVLVNKSTKLQFYYLILSYIFKNSVIKKKKTFDLSSKNKKQ